MNLMFIGKVPASRITRVETIFKTRILLYFMLMMFIFVHFCFLLCNILESFQFSSHLIEMDTLFSNLFIDIPAVTYSIFLSQNQKIRNNMMLDNLASSAHLEALSI